MRAVAGIPWVVLVGMVLTGCGRGNVEQDGTDKTARVILRILADEYGEYLATHGGQPPKDGAAFRQFLESQLDALAAYNVKSPDEILISPRDGQPLVIVCGKRIVSPEAPESPWAAYEQTGVDGKRMVVSVRGGAFELTTEEISRQVPPK